MAMSDHEPEPNQTPAEPGEPIRWTQASWPATPSTAAQSTIDQMTDQLQAVIGAAERAAEAIRRDAERAPPPLRGAAQGGPADRRAGRPDLGADRRPDPARGERPRSLRADGRALEAAINSVTDKLEQPALSGRFDPAGQPPEPGSATTASPPPPTHPCSPRKRRLPSNPSNPPSQLNRPHRRSRPPLHQPAAPAQPPACATARACATGRAPRPPQPEPAVPYRRRASLVRTPPASTPTSSGPRRRRRPPGLPRPWRAPPLGARHETATGPPQPTPEAAAAAAAGTDFGSSAGNSSRIPRWTVPGGSNPPRSIRSRASATTRRGRRRPGDHRRRAAALGGRQPRSDRRAGVRRALDRGGPGGPAQPSSTSREASR